MEGKKKSAVEVAIEKAKWDIKYHTEKLEETTEMLEALLLALATKNQSQK
jgi:hypothetical protein